MAEQVADIDPEAKTRELTDEIDAHLFEDGVLTLSDGTRADSRTVADVSGHQPMLELSQFFELSVESEDELINFVRNNTEFFGGETA